MNVSGILLCIGLVAASVQPANGQTLIDDTGLRLVAELQDLDSRGYKLASTVVLDLIERGTAKRFPMQFEAGTYAIVGACDKDCDHLQLSLLDATGALLIAGPEKQSVVIIRGTPQTAGSFALELATPGCKQQICQAGFVITRLDPSAPVGRENLTQDAANAERSLFVSHVASERTHEDALGTYSKLRALVPVALATKLPLIHETDLGSQGIWYRLRIGPPMSETEADALCVGIKAEGHGYCTAQPVEDDAGDKKTPTSLERNDSVERFDGTWTLTWKARDCQLPDGSSTATYSMAVSNGRLTGLGGRLSGKVSATGAAKWTVTAKTDGVLVRYTGTLSANRAAGRFARADGTCAGAFTARRSGGHEAIPKEWQHKPASPKRSSVDAPIFGVDKHEPPAGAVLWGKTVLVDDGSCPQGRIKEITGGNTRHGIPRQRRCIAR